jgi:hypothetical protein
MCLTGQDFLAFIFIFLNPVLSDYGSPGPDGFVDLFRLNSLGDANECLITDFFENPLDIFIDWH